MDERVLICGREDAEYLPSQAIILCLLRSFTLDVCVPTTINPQYTLDLESRPK